MHDNQRSDRGNRGGSRQRRTRGGSRSNDGSSRNNGGGYNRSSSSSSSSTAPYRSQAPRKLSFWQKLVAFFTGKSQSSSRSASAPSRGSSSSRPASEPAQNGHRRFESSSSAPARVQRKPELVEVNSPKLYVGNLSFDATEGDLFELFNGVGKVQNAEIVSNKYNHKSKGFAFVTMLTVDEARRAVTELHDKDFMGRKLVVSGAKTNDVRDGRGSQESSSREDEADAPQPAHEEAAAEEPAQHETPSSL